MYLTVQETDILPTQELLEQLVQFDKALEKIGTGAYSKLLKKYVETDVKYATKPTGLVKTTLLAKEDFIDRFKRRDLTSRLTLGSDYQKPAQGTRFQNAYSSGAAFASYLCKPK